MHNSVGQRCDVGSAGPTWGHRQLPADCRLVPGAAGTPRLCSGACPILQLALPDLLMGQGSVCCFLWVVKAGHRATRHGRVGTKPTCQRGQL